MNCPFLTEKKTCQHIDSEVGELVVISHTVCAYCIKSEPDAERRAEGYAVKNTVWTQRSRRGLEVGPIPTAKSMSQAEQNRLSRIRQKVNAAEAFVAAKNANAPVIADPKARLEICEDCAHWINGRCKEPRCQTCIGRPRPEADDGKDCPIGLWKRPAKSPA